MDDTLRKNPKLKIWYTADGRDIQIRQMSEGHIKNCLNLIRDHYPWRFRYFKVLVRELARRREQEA